LSQTLEWLRLLEAAAQRQQLVELKNAATGARLGNATKESWRDFIRDLKERMR
jgi:hypothetical protein